MAGEGEGGGGGSSLFMIYYYVSGEGEGGGGGPVRRPRAPAAPRPHAQLEDATDIERVHARVRARVGDTRY